MKTAMKTLLLLAAVCFAQKAMLADGPDVAAALKKRYADKTMLLRHAIPKDSQAYDATGQLLTQGEEGPWTVYSGFRPEKFSLSDEELRIQGHRLLFVFDQKRKMMLPAKSKDRLQVIIHLAKPLTTADDAEPLLHSVFAITNDEFIKLVPDYWEPYLTKQAERTRKGQPDDPPALLDRRGLPPGFHTAEGKNDVLLVDGKEIRPPVAQYTPEPSFSEFARGHRFQGTVVLDVIIDQTGKVVRPRIVRPLGMGLDEKAVEVVKTWRFKPSTKDGRPVAVEMAIEIEFKLYN